MYAIFTELDQALNREIEKIRNEIMTGCKFDEKKWQNQVHLSWQGAESYVLPETEERLRMIAKTFAPIQINVHGLGVFPGETPVLSLTIARTPRLSALNATLWEALQPLATGINTYFSPEKWIPHISLFYGDQKDAQAIGCAIEKLAFVPIHIEINLDHLILGSFDDNKGQEILRVPLTGRG